MRSVIEITSQYLNMQNKKPSLLFFISHILETRQSLLMKSVTQASAGLWVAVCIDEVCAYRSSVSLCIMNLLLLKHLSDHVHILSLQFIQTFLPLLCCCDFWPVTVLWCHYRVWHTSWAWMIATSSPRSALMLYLWEMQISWTSWTIYLAVSVRGLAVAHCNQLYKNMKGSSSKYRPRQKECWSSPSMHYTDDIWSKHLLSGPHQLTGWHIVWFCAVDTRL